MRRRISKTLSLLLGTLVSTSAQAQEPGEIACEYGPRAGHPGRRADHRDEAEL